MQDQFLSRVLPRGFDLVGPFSVSSYNPLVPPEFQLPDFGRQNALGFVFGCSKQLWLPFLHDLSQHPEKLSLNHPLDSYTEGVISEALVTEVLQASRGADDAHVDFQIRYSFSIGKDANKVAIQRLAHVARVAYLNEACHMNIHPTFGPFISLRAAGEDEEEERARFDTLLFHFFDLSSTLNSGVGPGVPCGPVAAA